MNKQGNTYTIIYAAVMVVSRYSGIHSHVAETGARKKYRCR